MEMTMIRTQVRRQIQIRKQANNNRSLAVEIERILPPVRKPASPSTTRQTNYR
jgi:hypothetical protein